MGMYVEKRGIRASDKTSDKDRFLVFRAEE